MSHRHILRPGPWLRAAAFVLAATLAAFAQTEVPPPDLDCDQIPDAEDPSVDPDSLNSDTFTTDFFGQRLARYFCPNQRFGENTCPPGSPIWTGRGPFAVASADFDEDGWNDVAVATRFDGRVWVHFNNQNLAGGQKINLARPIFRGTMGREDLNGNGVLDPGVCTGTETSCVCDLDCGEPEVEGSCVGSEDLNDDCFFEPADRNDENLGCVDTDPRTPCLTKLLATPGDLRGIVAADFNDDGHADVATVSFASEQVLVFLGDGQGEFGAARTFAAGSQPRDLISADFNGDGREDFAIPNFGANRVTVLLGNEDGTFGTGSTITSSPSPISAAAGDFDGDSRTDLAILNFGTLGAQGVTIALGNGDGTFRVLPNKAPAASGPFHIAVGQVNPRVDAHADIITVSVNEDEVLLILGRGDGSFHTPPNSEPGIQIAPEDPAGQLAPGPRFAAIGDVNADALPDVVIANFVQGNIGVWLSRGWLPTEATSVFSDGGNGPGFYTPAHFGTLPFPSAGMPPDGPRGFTLADLDHSATPEIIVGDLDAGSLIILTSGGDALGDACDNCPLVSNQDQANHDADPLGDACDTDDDNDAILDTLELTVYGTDPLNGDTDGDGQRDGIEIARLESDPLNADTDGDGVSDGAIGVGELRPGPDNCPLQKNGFCDTMDEGLNLARCDTDGSLDLSPLELEQGFQADVDGDSIGDTCDDDDDNDGITDSEEILQGTDPDNPDTDGDGVSDGPNAVGSIRRGPDNCPLIPNAPAKGSRQADLDGDGIGDECDPDIDGDGLSNEDEVLIYQTDPRNPDTDSDGLNDGAEIEAGTLPGNSDTDGDGLLDGDEIAFGADPHIRDTDGDGADDGPDNCKLTPNPDQLDSDGDGLGDGPNDPFATCFSDNSPCDLDDDNDGLTDVFELLGCFLGAPNEGLASNPKLADEDGDGWDDRRETRRVIGPTDPRAFESEETTNQYFIENFSPDGFGDGVMDSEDVCPLHFDPNQEDNDHDGLGDLCEFLYGFNGSNPSNPDTDGDGLLDGVEVFQFGSDPTLQDSDFDGILDAVEIQNGTEPSFFDTDSDGVGDNSDNCPTIFNPRAPSGLQPDIDADGLGDACDDDRDGDGLLDLEELELGTSPTSTDSDGDQLDDFSEVRIFGTNPKTPDTDKDGLPDGLDNCPLVSNASQSDFDADGAGDRCDCDPLDNQARFISDVGTLRAVRNFSTPAAISLSWQRPQPDPGSATGYDVVRGPLSVLSSSGEFQGVECLADLTSATGLGDDLSPAPGTALYYLVKAETACGGTYGEDSLGEQRNVPNVCPATVPTNGDRP